VCGLGHLNASPKPLTEGCLVYILGEPCPGALKRVGPGSRAANKEAST